MPAVLNSIGWALLHFVWQGAVVCVMLALVLSCMRRATAQARYFVACCAMALMAALPVTTAAYLLQAAPAVHTHMHTPADARITDDPLRQPVTFPGFNSQPVPAVPHAVTPVAPPDPLTQPAAQALVTSYQSLTHWLGMNIHVITLGWLAGTAVFSLRFLGGIAALGRLCRQTVLCDDPELLAACTRLAARIGIGRLPQCRWWDRSPAPMVYGLFRPLLLLPVSAFTGLTPLQVEALLAHELAHIRRHDYLVNMCQCLIETLLFYHPGVWWVSRVVRTEREHACDDLAVEACGGDRVALATALGRLEESRYGGALPALSAAGHPLLARIRRLAGEPGKGKTRMVSVLPLLATLALCTSGALLFAVEGPPPADPAMASPQTLRAMAPGFAPPALMDPAMAPAETADGGFEISKVVHVDSELTFRDLRVRVVTIDGAEPGSKGDRSVTLVARTSTASEDVTINELKSLVIGDYEIALLEARPSAPGESFARLQVRYRRAGTVAPTMSPDHAMRQQVTQVQKNLDHLPISKEPSSPHWITVKDFTQPEEMPEQYRVVISSGLNAVAAAQLLTSLQNEGYSKVHSVDEPNGLKAVVIEGLRRANEAESLIKDLKNAGYKVDRAERLDRNAKPPPATMPVLAQKAVKLLVPAEQLETRVWNLADLGSAPGIAPTPAPSREAITIVIEELQRRLQFTGAHSLNRKFWYDDETQLLTVVDRADNIKRIENYLQQPRVRRRLGHDDGTTSFTVVDLTAGQHVNFMGIGVRAEHVTSLPPPAGSSLETVKAAELLMRTRTGAELKTLEPLESCTLGSFVVTLLSVDDDKARVEIEVLLNQLAMEIPL